MGITLWKKLSLKLYLNKYWSCRCKLSKNLLKVLYSYENVLFPFGSCSISCERKIFCYFDLDHTLYEPAGQLSYNVTVHFTHTRWFSGLNSVSWSVLS